MFLALSLPNCLSQRKGPIRLKVGRIDKLVVRRHIAQKLPAPRSYRCRRDPRPALSEVRSCARWGWKNKAIRFEVVHRSDSPGAPDGLPSQWAQLKLRISSPS